MVNKIIKEIIDYLFVIVIAIIIATIISTQVFSFSQVKQSSMENTLVEGDILIIEKISLLFSDPDRDDIVVLLDEDNVNNSFMGKIQRLYRDMLDKFRGIQNKNRLVKRVIGLEGDIIDIKDGKVYVNNKEISEPYINSETEVRPFGIEFPIEVPEGQYFVLGDNREVSKDSRDFGCVPKENIEGIAVFRVYPFNKFGRIK